MARWWWIPFLERQEQTTQCSQKVWGLNSKNRKSHLFCSCSARDRVQLCSAAISAWHLHRHSSRLPGDFHIFSSFRSETIPPLFAAFLYVRGERTVNCVPLSKRDNLQPTVLRLWLVNIKRLRRTVLFTEIHFQVVQHWLCSSTGLLQLEPVPLRRTRRGWVHFYPFLIILISLWRSTMQLSLLYRWLAEAGKCCCVCR